MRKSSLWLRGARSLVGLVLAMVLCIGVALTLSSCGKKTLPEGDPAASSSSSDESEGATATMPGQEAEKNEDTDETGVH